VSTQTDQPTVADLSVGDEVDPNEAPICCGTDMELEHMSHGMEWACSSCDAYVRTFGGVVTDIDR
jgi:hypothetical protein